MTWRWGSVWPVWVVAAVGAVAAGVFAPTQSLVWMPILLGVSTLVAFGIQLAGPTQKGLVDRLAMSVAGAALVLVIATLILLPLKLLH